MRRVIVFAAAVAVGGLVPSAALVGGSAWGASDLCVSTAGTQVLQRGTATCGAFGKKSAAVATGGGAGASAVGTRDRAVATGSGSEAATSCFLVCITPTNSSAVATGQGSVARVDSCALFCTNTKNSAVATTPGCTAGPVSGVKQSEQC